MTLHLESSGKGPDLLLVHGWAMHSGIFSPILPYLEAHFRVHRLDLPGHGHSLDSTLPLDFDAVWQALLPRLDGPAYVLGWSLGGLFALHGGIRYPQSCRALILQNASPCFVLRPDWPYGMPASVFRQFASDLSRDYDRTLQRFMMLEAQGCEHLRDTLRHLQKTAFEYGHPRAGILADGLDLLAETDMRPLMAGMTMPTLWLAGRRDRLVNAQAMQVAAALCQGRFILDEHGGHAPFLTHPETIADTILDFTRELS